MSNFEGENIEQEVYELLVAGGYFRARITTLDAFDKIAGGLAWGILASKESIDVDFIEGANIGQKIAISENIDAALREMKCPIRLAAHQIQGLDMPVLKAVFQWLLQIVMQTRQQNAASLAKHANLLFQRHIQTTGSEAPLKEVNAELADCRYGVNIPIKQAPVRAAKRTVTGFSSRADHVLGVLMEYGEDVGILKDASEEEAEARDAALVTSEEEELLRSQMGAFAARDKLSAATMLGVVQGGGSSWAAQAQDLTGKLDALRGALAEEEAERNVVGLLTARLEALEGECAKAQREAEAAEAANAELEATLAAAEASVGKRERATARIQQEYDALLAEIEADPQLKAAMEALRAARKQRDDKLAELAAFERNVKKWTAEWKEKQDALLAEIPDDDTEESAALDAAFAAARERLEKVGRKVSKRNIEIMLLQQKIDDVPTRAELHQYQRRFTELHEQIALKNGEWKQLYSKQNTLVTRAQFMRNQAELLDNLAAQMELSAKSKSSREEYLNVVAQKSAELDAARQKLTAKLDTDALKAEDATKAYTELLMQLRGHAQMVKAMVDEMARNEELTQKLALKQAEAAAS